MESPYSEAGKAGHRGKGDSVMAARLLLGRIVVE